MKKKKFPWPVGASPFVGSVISRNQEEVSLFRLHLRKRKKRKKKECWKEKKKKKHRQGVSSLIRNWRTDVTGPLYRSIEERVIDILLEFSLSFLQYGNNKHHHIGGISTRSIILLGNPRGFSDSLWWITFRCDYDENKNRNTQNSDWAQVWDENNDTRWISE